MWYHPKHYKELKRIAKQEADKQASERASEQARNQAERGSTSAECDPNHQKREAEQIYSLQADRGASCFRIDLYGQESPPGPVYMYAFVWLSGTIFDVD